MYGIAGLLTGRTLCGRYRIEAVVGRGGMGAVYRATDERLGRAVAVKVIGIVAHEEQEHARLQTRFLREARAAAGLHHPNVVAVHDFGADEELGLDFLVMELLQGEDLALRLARSGPPPAHVSLSILRQAAKGLAAGHRAGLVHRDVKPGNLFLEAGDDPDQPTVRVLDFGIAQVPAEEGTVTHLTEYGRAPFSPAYASPEQMRGDDRISPASDVFSLGAVGYHLLTGYRPFTASDATRAAGETAEALRLFPERAPHLPHGVIDVLARALAPHAASRYHDAGELAAALSAAVGIGPGQATRETTGRSTTATVPPRTVRPLAAAVSVEPADEATSIHTGPRARPATVLSGATLYAPQPPALAREDADPTVSPPARPGFFRRAAAALWDFTVTTAIMGLFVASWALAGQGALDGQRKPAFAGMAAAILFTPLAIHRLTGRRGRLGMGIAASLVATGAGVYWMGLRTDPAITLAGVFGLQVTSSFVMARLTRRRITDPYAGG